MPDAAFAEAGRRPYKDYSDVLRSASAGPSRGGQPASATATGPAATATGPAAATTGAAATAAGPAAGTTTGSSAKIGRAHV